MDPIIIRVDRTRGYQYPNWASNVVYPVLVKSGPTMYDLLQVKLWRNEHQIRGAAVSSLVLYTEAEKLGFIDKNLSIKDAVALTEHGVPETVAEFLGTKRLVFWKSITYGKDGRMNAPYLYFVRGTPRLGWLDVSAAISLNSDYYTPLYPE